MSLERDFSHTMTVQAIAKTISKAINVNCASKHNCFPINMERNMKSCVKCESSNTENYCGFNWNGVGGMDTKQATTLMCIKVDKSIRHLVYDSLLVLNIKPGPSSARSVLSISVCCTVKLDSALEDVAYSVSLQYIVFCSLFLHPRLQKHTVPMLSFKRYFKVNMTQWHLPQQATCQRKTCYLTTRIHIYLVRKTHPTDSWTCQNEEIKTVCMWLFMIIYEEQK